MIASPSQCEARFSVGKAYFAVAFPRADDLLSRFLNIDILNHQTIRTIDICPK